MKPLKVKISIQFNKHQQDLWILVFKKVCVSGQKHEHGVHSTYRTIQSWKINYKLCCWSRTSRTSRTSWTSLLWFNNNINLLYICWSIYWSSMEANAARQYMLWHNAAGYEWLFQVCDLSTCYRILWKCAYLSQDAFNRRMWSSIWQSTAVSLTPDTVNVWMLEELNVTLVVWEAASYLHRSLSLCRGEQSL